MLLQNNYAHKPLRELYRQKDSVYKNNPMQTPPPRTAGFAAQRRCSRRFVFPGAAMRPAAFTRAVTLTRLVPFFVVGLLAIVGEEGCDRPTVREPSALG